MSFWGSQWRDVEFAQIGCFLHLRRSCSCLDPWPRIAEGINVEPAFIIINHNHVLNCPNARTRATRVHVLPKYCQHHKPPTSNERTPHSSISSMSVLAGLLGCQQNNILNLPRDQGPQTQQNHAKPVNISWHHCY